MRIYKTRELSKQADKIHLTDADLAHAIKEIEAGLIDAYLGSSLLKSEWYQ